MTRRPWSSVMTLALALLAVAGGNLANAQPALVAARVKFFGAENVDATTGAVKKNVVLFSWATNASIVASVLGRVVMLDTYINRLELPSPANQSDLRRSPINVQDLVDLGRSRGHPGLLRLHGRVGVGTESLLQPGCRANGRAAGGVDECEGVLG